MAKTFIRVLSIALLLAFVMMSVLPKLLGTASDDASKLSGDDAIGEDFHDAVWSHHHRKNGGDGGNGRNDANVGPNHPYYP
ncbi:hypothetical protein MKW94_003040 [Papaver nudicaule]|uniref:Glycine-rich protein n=1 Tax=Papaver nudicaule TaxID=74823 RepID=A0AA41SNN7_PAPNU|nr:hypothetical protein [Papaver nudicaule]